MERCILCQSEGPLVRSHVYPEFLYTPLYGDGDHRYRLIAAETGCERLLQKGHRERLLCETCDNNRLSKIEKYFKETWFDHHSLSAGWHTAPRVAPVEYTPFKLFLLSLLLRASCAADTQFEDVQLGHHQDNLRRMILSDDAGRDFEYPIRVRLAVDRHGRSIRRLIVAPMSANHAGRRVYQFIFAGAEWTYFVSSGTDRVPATEYNLHADGILRLTPVHCPQFEAAV